MGEFLNIMGGLFITILIVGALFEVILLGISYFYADKVQCNLLWCTFTFKDTITTNETINDTISNSIKNMTESAVCYLNNVEVNCSNYLNWSLI